MKYIAGFYLNFSLFCNYNSVYVETFFFFFFSKNINYYRLRIIFMFKYILIKLE